jgi:glucose dehydrogenase
MVADDQVRQHQDGVNGARACMPSPDNDWLMWRRTYDAWGYSPPKQIDTGNVKNLTVAWSWAMTPGSTETTPMVRPRNRRSA